MSNPDNPSFCVLPWFHQVIGTTGELRVCCYMDQGHDTVDNLENAWNNDYMRDLRARMMAGEHNAECRACHAMERDGQQSARQSYNDLYYTTDNVQRRLQTMDENFRVAELPTFLEIRFGNRCNLMCKMCSGTFSSQIVKDQNRLKKIDPVGYTRHIDKIYPTPEVLDLPAEWYESPEVWKTLDALIPQIERIDIAGGEPTLIRENIEFLKRCINLGHARSISVAICTNVTNINQEFLDLTDQFKTFGITFSVDGVGATYEYIRYPGDWETVRNNMAIIMRLCREHGTRFPERYSGLHVAFNTVIQAFNMMNIGEMFDEFIDLLVENADLSRVSHIKPIILSWPERFSLEEQPENIKIAAKARLQNWITNGRHAAIYPIIFGEGALEGILTRLDTPASGKNSPAKLLDYIRFVDQNKSVKAAVAIPEYYHLLAQAVQAPVEA